ncbi:MAG: RNA polymerase sigma factor [Pedobacter sp.]|nr:MAG: RNA polymerase sigma factor [Pedobacter sp.]
MKEDRADFSILFFKYEKLVFNLCLNYTLDTDDAKDVAQEVFIKIFQRHYQFRASEGSEKNWICGITINHCLDFLKAKRRKKRFGSIVSLFNPDSNEPIDGALSLNHPGIEMEQKEELEILLKMIYELPENQKTVVVLLKIEGHSQKEVAEIMELSVKAVESLFQRAKEKIKKSIASSEGF